MLKVMIYLVLCVLFLFFILFLINFFKKNKIIHISGYNNSGKTTLGEMLKDILDSKKALIVDIDNLMYNFLKQYEIDHNNNDFQRYIDEFISNNISYKTIIFVGLSYTPNLRLKLGDSISDNKNISVDLHHNYGFFIDVDNDTLLKNSLGKKYHINDIISKYITTYADTTTNEDIKKYYLNHGYILLSFDEIYNKIKIMLL